MYTRIWTKFSKNNWVYSDSAFRDRQSESIPVLVNPGNRTNADTEVPYIQAVATDAPVAYWRLGRDSGHERG